NLSLTNEMGAARKCKRGYAVFSTKRFIIHYFIYLDGDLVLFVSCRESKHLPVKSCRSALYFGYMLRLLASHNCLDCTLNPTPLSVLRLCDFGFSGMDTRSMTRKRKNADPTSWSNFDRDLLLLIMMHLGLFDFFAFSGVCKSWRSLAVSNWKKFMASKQPMYLSISNRMNKKECYIEDYTRRKLKTMLPHSRGRTCVGLTCGYLILFGKKAQDFWLVNPFTKKELHFPGFHYDESIDPKDIKGILVFSPSMSGWVFVVLPCRDSYDVAFSLAGKQAKWRHIYFKNSIQDLHFFKGKLYMLMVNTVLCELRFNPLLTFIIYKMKRCPLSCLSHKELVSSGEKLYVAYKSRNMFDAIEANFNEMEWMYKGGTIDEYALFLSDLKCDVAIKPDSWAHPWTQYERLNYTDGGDQSKKKGRCLTTDMWYFPHDCLIDHNAGMENGALLNVLEEVYENNSNHLSLKLEIR
ncbi:hypothetical protein M8C21_014526, partial [Ambrosia artemisiifolia]